MGSPKAVPVPCTSTIDTSRPLAEASCRAAEGLLLVGVMGIIWESKAGLGDFVLLDVFWEKRNIFAEFAPSFLVEKQKKHSKSPKTKKTL